mmetsp:Transcript_2539/g.6180  ORF Transcript_2539/g.6180 Transcript_2539/m.6180 type:complete len:99 (-) Transcript_2539:279-575(-)
MKQQPAWKQVAVSSEFSSNPAVAFAEVNVREQRQLGMKHQAGAGGWPTLKYFNKETGPEGRKYEQKTKQAVCDEMKDPVAVETWVKDFGFKAASKAEL